jgi:hypothetical protein
MYVQDAPIGIYDWHNNIKDIQEHGLPVSTMTKIVQDTVLTLFQVGGAPSKFQSS